MSKNGVWIIIGIALILIGSLIFIAVMKNNHWNFTALGTQTYETNTYSIHESFENIHIRTVTTDIELLPATDGLAKVVCFESDRQHHSVTVNDGTLTVTLTDEAQKWYHHIGITVKTPKITVYLPEEAYTSLVIETTTGDTNLSHPFRFQNAEISCTTGDIECKISASDSMKLKTTTGDIDVKGVSVGETDISVNTGDIKLSEVTCQSDVRIHFGTGDAALSDVSCKNLTAKGNTSDFAMDNVIAVEKFSVTTNTGDIFFQRCDAASLFMKANTGDIRGSLLSEKIFITKTTTGSVRVPSTASGGTCELITGTGDITVTIKSN
jgi:DUF4097 and DUF4098 domain-containing protein YvlB